MNKKRVVRNFSKYAHVYDRYADVQRRISLELLELAGKKDIRKILEIGSGTGNYTFLLKERFADARIKAIDISEKMTEVACGKIKSSSVEFLVTDAEMLDVNERFGLITSNACFQWFGDLETALRRYGDLLEEGGLILFSIFGPRTFFELDNSLKRVSKDLSVSAVNFTAKEKIKRILETNFKNSEIKESVYEESFLNLRGLLDKIKYSGANGFGSGRKVFFTPGILKKLELVYLNSFGKIRATYQVFLCLGEK